MKKLFLNFLSKIFRKPKICFILRGVSGSGKSTLANYLAKLNSAVVCSADDYFGKDYNFSVEKLGAAHSYCYNKFLSALLNNKNVIVDNTNTSISEYKKYSDIAKQNGYKIFILVVENHHGSKSIHNVPEKIINKQTQKLNNSLLK